ncbi:MAG: ANTAR domain-containing protein [Mycobacteriales bacterium]
MPRSELDHPAISAALSASATLLGMEVAFIGGLTEDNFMFERVLGTWDGIEEGRTELRTDSLCGRMLAGGPNVTCDVPNDPVYGDSPCSTKLGIRSYVGVPIFDSRGQIVGTLCGIDRGIVDVDHNTVAVLSELAGVIAAHLEPGRNESTIIRRTPQGWQVAGSPAEDLTSAMALADILGGELETGGRPPRPAAELDELAQLRLSMTQLEHALVARVKVEQAIGVLAERQRLSTRSSFERLRKAARGRGRRVHDLAREVVASTTDASVPLPPELAGRR